MNNNFLHQSEVGESKNGMELIIGGGFLCGYVLFTVVVGVAAGGQQSLIIQAVLMLVIGWLYVVRELYAHGKTTLCAAFVGVYSFIYAARALYVGVFSDFSLFMRPFAISPTWDELNMAMSWLALGMIAFIGGGQVMDRRARMCTRYVYANWRSLVTLRKEPSVVQLLVLFGIQIAVIAAIFPMAKGPYKVNLVDVSSSAYGYLLPTLSHGVNLYVVTVLLSWAWVKKSPVLLVASGIAVILTLFNAYLLANLSTFRGFWTAGMLLIAVAVLHVVRGRLNPLFIVILFLIYPYFKQVGVDRGLSNKETIGTLFQDPSLAYSTEGLETAYGAGTDLNMFDTFVASRLYSHGVRPYVKNVLYTFVHWVPRTVWPGKPVGGSYIDVQYTNGAPYSPGIIGFFNDEGGAAYMILMMFILGVAIRYLDIRVAMVREGVLQACVYACLFFGVIVLTRSLLYQAFYGVLAFLLPLLLVSKIVNIGSPLRVLPSPQRNKPVLVKRF